MANTVWKGQLTFGLVSFPVRLVRAARKERIPLRLVRTTGGPEPREEEENETETNAGPSRAWKGAEPDEADVRDSAAIAAEPIVTRVRQSYVADQEDTPLVSRDLERGYEVAPGQFAVVRSEEIRRLRRSTSSSMEIVRSVHMNEIDPVFLETSYYVLPGNSGEHPYALFYYALKESGYAALAEVAMHGRQHVVVLRPGAKGLIAHTMYYVNEVRRAEEYLAESKDVAPKELNLAKRFVEAIAAPFQPDEYSDRYREQLKALIESKETVTVSANQNTVPASVGKLVDIMDALTKSLERVKVLKTARKPSTSTAPAKARKRRA